MTGATVALPNAARDVVNLLVQQTDLKIRAFRH
jgi:hypothetical protein